MAQFTDIKITQEAIAKFPDLYPSVKAYVSEIPQTGFLSEEDKFENFEKQLNFVVNKTKSAFTLPNLNNPGWAWPSPEHFSLSPVPYPYGLEISDDRGSLMIKVTDSWILCHEFELGTTEDSPCRGTKHVQSVKTSNILPLV
ncbi:hypothetical protein TNCV_654051 [Trichonephila clavipes]|nr:hypothetical protein TNCV_654051 [Trichonephila clavipes]